ncbi:unnamed protein product [Paramecium octaurelia]|uniref:Uncharacterized protein n=1 Tax=Paramecium octaurelia TaxID=43137 RepID=A0A8S1XVA5_PAROT|nr:unnamed protein product [Paramecium octaurelia]
MFSFAGVDNCERIVYKNVFKLLKENLDQNKGIVPRWHSLVLIKNKKVRLFPIPFYYLIIIIIKCRQCIFASNQLLIFYFVHFYKIQFLQQFIIQNHLQVFQYTCCVYMKVNQIDA